MSVCLCDHAALGSFFWDLLITVCVLLCERGGRMAIEALWLAAMAMTASVCPS
jgi:hypothetical protein